MVFIVRLPNRKTHLCAYVAMCYLWCCVYCLLTVCVQYSFNNQLCVSNVNYVRHYDVLRQYYVDCMYTLFVLYPTATLRVGDTKLHDYP